MKSITTDKFWKCYAKLPIAVRKQAKDAYRMFFIDPYHSSLRFKRVHSVRPIFSVRITRDYRALGLVKDNEIMWFWIGSHSDYDKLL